MKLYFSSQNVIYLTVDETLFPTIVVREMTITHISCVLDLFPRLAHDCFLEVEVKDY